MKKLVVLLLSVVYLFGIEVGEKPKEVILAGKDGGYVKDNKPFSTNDIRGKVYIVFYVDPDEKDKNEVFAEALKKKHYNRAEYGSIAIVNMAATWKPDFAIEMLLEKKQKEFPDTIYIKDKKSVLVKEWGIANDESDILLFDKDGKLLFYKAGKMTPSDMKKVFNLIEERISWNL
ncbi:MAG: transcriptional regulator [Epsilonproteobacteria bacterium]|nr:transcriptional regulator [Campylobacterota bacterium]